jgi:hypothetical protein
MDRHDVALALAGVIGAVVALIHGRLTQQHMVRPLEALTADRLPRGIRRLVAGLLQFSTFNWFIGGIALVIAVVVCGREAQLTVGLLVGSSYLYGAIGNAWATRGRHPGWALYALAVLLIAYGLVG